MYKSLVYLILISGFSLSAQNTLQGYVDAALRNSAVIIDNQHQVAISGLEQKRLRAAVVGPRAYISADYLLAPYFHNPTFTDTDPSPQAIGYDINVSNGGLYSALLNVNQPIFTGKIVGPQLKAADVNQRQYRYTNSLEAHTLQRKVTDQYIKAYQSQLLVAASANLVGLMGDQVKIVNRLVEAGILKNSDALLIALEKKSQQATLKQAQSQYLQDLADLNILVGIKEGSPSPLAKTEISIGPEVDSVSAFLIQYQLDSLNQQTSVAVFNTAYVPSLNAFANAGLNAVAVQNIQRKVGFSVGLSLNIPLYDGHQKNLNEQKSKLALESVSSYKQRKRVELVNNLEKFKAAIQANEVNLALLNEQEEDYTDLLKLYRAQILAGQVSIMDYVNVLKQYRQVQQNAINAKAKLLTSKNAYNYWNW